MACSASFMPQKMYECLTVLSLPHTHAQLGNQLPSKNKSNHRTSQKRDNLTCSFIFFLFFLFSSFWLLHFSCLLFLLREEELPFIIIIDLIIMWLFSASMHALEINDCTSYAFVSFCFPLQASLLFLMNTSIFQKPHVFYTTQELFFWEGITK